MRTHEVMDDGAVDRLRIMRGGCPVRTSVVPVLRGAAGFGGGQSTILGGRSAIQSACRPIHGA